MRHLVTALLLAAALGACRKHPTPEERQKEYEQEQQMMMQKLLNAAAEAGAADLGSRPDAGPREARPVAGSADGSR